MQKLKPTHNEDLNPCLALFALDGMFPTDTTGLKSPHRGMTRPVITPDVRRGALQAHRSSRGH